MGERQKAKGERQKANDEGQRAKGKGHRWRGGWKQGWTAYVGVDEITSQLHLNE